ncbi:MAG: hypothetical protein JNJ73_21445 [Hyphomonadaceae bacterium]|nr:hypothetical protein [Hyphomonadaceae bacterium]
MRASSSPRPAKRLAWVAIGSITLTLTATAIATRRRRRRHRAEPSVRDAGPENMQCPPRRWDVVDQASDESFPASDAPARY